MSNVRQSLYAEVTNRIIAELEAGRLPWVQPWDAAACPCTMPVNAATGRRYSGINILMLWAAVIEGGYTSQRWLTFAQANGAGGHVRKGERGTIICYADRFTPKHEEERARDEDREARQVAFLKRFTVFNVDQCEGLPERFTPILAPMEEQELIPAAHDLIRATGADVRIGGGEAYYAPRQTLPACRRSRHSPSRSTGTALCFTSLVIGRAMVRGWAATSQARSAVQPMPARSLWPRWQAHSPARRFRSSRAYATATMSAAGCRCCARTRRRSSARPVPPARQRTICWLSRAGRHDP